MHRRIRMKGSILLSGNIGIMILTLITAAVIIFSANLSVLLYEVSFKIKVEELFGASSVYVNFAVSLMFLLFCFGIYSQIKLGTDRFFFRRAQKKGGTAGDIFYYFHPLRAADAIIFNFRLTAVKALLLLLSLVPFMVSSVLLFWLMKSNVSALVAVGLFCGCVAFLICGIIFYINISLSFFLSKYYFLDGRFVSFSHLVASSQQDMKTRIKILRRLKLSFCGWFLLCLLILPVGYVWSYYHQTMALAAATFMKN